MAVNSFFEQFQQQIGYQFQDLGLLAAAFRHASSANNRRDSNERMEFLGDAVLGLIVCHALYESLPEALEGELTKIKSAVVSRATCALVADGMELTDGLVLGQGMDNGLHLPKSLAAGTLEAVIGAIYLDGGLEPAREFVLTQMDEQMRAAVASQHQNNFKSQLQQWAQRELGDTPSYELLDEKGPDHAKCFEIAVAVGDRRFPSAWGTSKKEAEQKAARLALINLGQLPEFEEDMEPAY